MAVSSQAAAVALQLEKVRSKISALYPHDSTFADKIERVENNLVSSRAMRLPVDMYPGSVFGQTTFAGTDLGVGGATNYQVFQTTPIGFVLSGAWSLDAEWSTDKSEQAVASYTKRELKKMLEEFACHTDVVSQSDGTGTIDSVNFYNASPAYIAVNNPNRFRANAVYQCLASIGGTNRGTFTVSSVDVLSGRIYVTLSGSFSGSPTANDLILINGAPGTTANTSLNGLTAIQNDPGNTGSYAGLTRSSFPGMLRTPHIDAGGQALTAEQGRTAIQKFRLRNGRDKKEFMWYMGLDQEQAVEAISQQVQSVITNQVKEDNSVDPIKFDAPKSFVGRPLEASITAAPGRIDGLMLKHWVKSSVLPGGGDPQPLAWQGQTQWPQYGTSGGLAAATMTYLVSYWQMISDNPAAGLYIDNLPINGNLPLGSNNAS